MPPAEIPDDILEFLTRRIDSVPHLEALLLFFENPDKLWTGAEIASRVYVSRDRIREILVDLARHGFIRAEDADGYCYQKSWDEAGLMSRVADIYSKHIVHIAELIHAKATPTAVEEFARAFKFTKKE
jgi:hypothetical protein